MKSLSQQLTVRPSVFDKNRRDVVLDITNLIAGQVDPDDFFKENYITRGMQDLYRAVFKRLEGNSDDGLFRLTQSMGGGKTHNMIAIGLLAKFPEYREKVMGHIYNTTLKGGVNVIGFSGREKPELGIWGYLAEQLGKKDIFKKRYAPLEAPGQEEWEALLANEKLVIILDELPPYLEGAYGKTIGDSNLATITTQALSNLFVALGKKELKQVVVIISDLTANWTQGSELIGQIVKNLEDETHRGAKPFTPVEQTGDEIYNILRTRIFDNQPSTEEIEPIALAYAAMIKEAKQMDITTETPERFAQAVKDSYPFHPAIKDLFARFKENPGFQQTRGLIRLMRTIVSRMFDPEEGWAGNSYLIAPYDLDFNDSDTLTEIAGINSKLTNAISHDIYGNPSAVAQILDEKFDNSLASDAAKLILVSSLSVVQNAVRGLHDWEIIRNLCKPGVEISKVAAEILPELKNTSWYLHIDNTGKFLYKDVQNVVAKLNDYIKGYNQESIKLEIKAKLQRIFEPKLKDCYQKVYALPALDEIEPEQFKTSLIIYQPFAGSELHPDLETLFKDTQWQNRVLFLTGDAHSMASIFENAAGLKAIDAILGEFRSEKVQPNDPQFIEAEKLKETFLFKFNSAVRETFVKIFYPTKNGLMPANFQMQFKDNNFDGEDQIKKTLVDKRKFTEDINSDTFQKYVEGKLFHPQKTLPWNEIKKKAATNTDWIWHKMNALDQLKDELILKDLWRANGDWIEIGPFEPPKTSVTYRIMSRNDDTGEVALKIIPSHGDRVHFEIGDKVSTASQQLDLALPFKTSELKATFLCTDSKNVHETGDPLTFNNTITLKHRFFQDDDRLMLELKAAPKADIRFTTNGSDPSNSGKHYEGPVAIPTGVSFIIALAEKDGIKSEKKEYKVPARDQGPYEPIKTKPAILKRKITRQSTSETYEWLKMVSKHRIILSGVTFSINGKKWASIDVYPEMQFDHDKLNTVLSFLRNEILNEGEIELSAQQLHFETGQLLLDYIRDTRDQLKPNEVEQ
ncbi:MAG TPA: DUF499 domain-containing protein [Bacteroidales bacterium]|nr:DUF499 domain-containing protein [Bacteroidales bacterium]HSA43822.1 DUF499 domain-containing protein [Bacteroidales bacterium]